MRRASTRSSRSSPRRPPGRRKTRASSGSGATSSPRARAAKVGSSSCRRRRPRSSARSGPARQARWHRRSRPSRRTLDPKLSSADAKRFAPKMRVISSFSVYYQVIVNNHFGGNIEAPATKINGTVVPPGGKFDFWKVVGDLRKLPGTGRATRSRAARSPSPARSAAESAPRPRRCSTPHSVPA